VQQLNRFRAGTYSDEAIAKIPAWNADRDFPEYRDGAGMLHGLEKREVFFSHPLDLDLMLLEAYPDAYGVTVAEPSESTKKAVLGKNRVNLERLGETRLELFDEYQGQFKLGSKPASHIAAMAELDDDELIDGLPDPLSRLVEAVRHRLESIPE
jgi:putative ATP-dependent endonuclease of the OLD family